MKRVDNRTAATAITPARQYLNAGLPHETLLVCSKLGSHGTRAEPARIGALLHLGRNSESKEATIELTRA
jgi:hypothetical protein